MTMQPFPRRFLSSDAVAENAGAGAADSRLRARTRSALLLVGVLIFGLLGMAAVLQVSGAVIGMGSVAVDSSVKTISHSEGGIVSAVLVREGDHVEAGQVLMRLDSTVSAVGSRSAATGLEQLRARQARLQAERDGEARLRFPPELGRDGDAEVQAMLAREARLFALHRDERRGALALLRERVRQYDQQVESLEAQIDAIDRQMRLIEPELEGLRRLYARQLVTINRINQMERTAVQLEGSRAALESNIAEARARISETREEMLNIDRTQRSDAASQLAQVSAQLNEQELRLASASDTYARSVIRAPQSGTVDQIAYTTVGSAVPPAQPILQIVPDDDPLVIEAQVRPQDGDQLQVGQVARVAFSGLDRQTTPDVAGTLTFVSPDLVRDERSGVRFYRIKVALDSQALARNPQIELQPGMPAEVFVQTGSRSILSFLVKPLLDQLRYAFREG